jgi:FMN-dependent NADH-azoreductase
VETLDLFATDLPPFEAPQAAAKYSVLRGREPAGRDAQAWKRLIDVIRHFQSAQLHVISSPMWNFGIPYRLKQYVDVIVQPGLTFSFSPAEGYKGLLNDRRAVLILARGGASGAGTGGEAYDMQKPYLEGVLRFMGIDDIRSVLIEPTLAGGAPAAEAAFRQATQAAEKMAREI